MEISEKEAARISRAADIREIQQLMARYVQFISQMNPLGAYETLFDLDNLNVGVEINECGGYIGPESTRRFMEKYQAYMRDPTDKRGWMDIQEINTPLVVFSKDRNLAKGQWSIFSPQAKLATAYPGSQRTLTAIWCFGKFHCDFIRTESGWKILKLRELTFVRAPFDIGWNAQAECYNMPAELYAHPDTPPRTSIYNTDAVYSGHGLFNWGPYIPADGSF